LQTEEKLLERLDQAILEVIDKPEKTQQTTAIGTLFWQTLYQHVALTMKVILTHLG